VKAEFKKARQQRQTDSVLDRGGKSAGKHKANPFFAWLARGAHAVVLNQEVGEGREQDDGGGQSAFLAKCGGGNVRWDKVNSSGWVRLVL
jgi:hypothetical protein